MHSWNVAQNGCACCKGNTQHDERGQGKDGDVARSSATLGTGSCSAASRRSPAARGPSTTRDSMRRDSFCSRRASGAATDMASNRRRRPRDTCWARRKPPTPPMPTTAPRGPTTAPSSALGSAPSTAPGGFRWRAHTRPCLAAAHPSLSARPLSAPLWSAVMERARQRGDAAGRHT